MNPGIDLPKLPDCRELRQRQARDYAAAVEQAKTVIHFAQVGPRAVAYVTSRWSRWVTYSHSHARRQSVAERLLTAVLGGVA